MKKLLTLLCALILTGCVTTPTAPFISGKLPFDESAFMPYAGGGTSTINGNAFMTTRGGDVVVGAGRVVSLVPLTPYSNERRGLLDAYEWKVKAPDPGMEKYARETVADSQGNFTFTGLAPGDYIVAITIRWNYGRGYTGGRVSKQVTVGVGETIRVILTR